MIHCRSMLLRRSLLQLPFAWLVVLVVATTPFGPGFDLDLPAAWAQDEDEDEDSEDEDEDEDGGGDEEEEDEEEEGEEDEEQPPVTAGGMYTKQSWPVMENLRPMTLNRGMFEIRTGFNMDLSALDAFETWRVPIDAKIGLRDHVELQAGIDFLLVTTQTKQDAFEEFGSLLPPLDAFVVNL